MSKSKQATTTQEQTVPRDTVTGEDADEDLAFYQDVELLQSHGINVSDIKKLQGVGICTIKGIMMTTKKRLNDIKGLSEAKVDKIKEIAAKLTNPGFITALEVAEKRKMCFRISTGSQELDK